MDSSSIFQAQRNKNYFEPRMETWVESVRVATQNGFSRLLKAMMIERGMADKRAIIAEACERVQEKVNLKLQCPIEEALTLISVAGSPRVA